MAEGELAPRPRLWQPIPYRRIEASSLEMHDPRASRGTDPSCRPHFPTLYTHGATTVAV